MPNKSDLTPSGDKPASPSDRSEDSMDLFERVTLAATDNVFVSALLNGCHSNLANKKVRIGENPYQSQVGFFRLLAFWACSMRGDG